MTKPRRAPALNSALTALRQLIGIMCLATLRNLVEQLLEVLGPSKPIPLWLAIRYGRTTMRTNTMTIGSRDAEYEQLVPPASAT